MASNKTKSMAPKVYQFVYEEDEKNKNLPPILNLRPELRVKIWNLIGEGQKKAIRLVCTALKNDIDTKIGLSINLDERKFIERDAYRTLPTSASSLRVWGQQITSDYVIRLLLNSRLIKSVTFSGPTDLVNVTKILTRCPNLISIVFTDQSALDSKLQIPMKLRCIKSLHLGAEGKFSDYNPDNLMPTPWSTFSDILRQVTLPCLKILNIEYTSPIDSSTPFGKIVNEIFKYLVTHNTVVDLTIRLQKGKDHLKAGAISRSISNEDSLQLTFPLERLSNIRLKRLTAATDEVVFKIWDIILHNQTELEYLDFLNQKKDWRYFTPIIKNNAASLRVVRLRKLIPVGYTADSRADLHAFERCLKLKELFISRFENSTQEVCYRLSPIYNEFPFLDQISSKLPELIQFKTLPLSLEKLQVQGFTVKTEDLSWIALRLKKLRLLELQMLGYRGPGDSKLSIDGGEIPRDTSRHGLGVTPVIVKGLLTKLRKLDTLFIEEFYNNRTLIKDFDLKNAIKEISLIPGDNLLKVQSYFGILIDNKEPVYDHEIPREKRADLWDVRFNQYRYQNWIEEKFAQDKNDNRPY